MRLDLFLKEKKYFESRKKAQTVIKNGLVKINGRIETKISKNVSENDEIKIIKNELSKYVSRAALKLATAYKNFEISFQDKIILDLGASTGGFSDFCLQNGAKKIYAVDVGHGQLHQKIKENPNVINLEKTDARKLDKKLIPEKFDILVSDLSFISIFKVLPEIIKNFGNNFEGIILFKPQFEVGKENIQKGGIVKNEEIVKIKLDEAVKKFQKLGFNKIKYIKSEIKGGDGNQEYLF